MGSLAQEPQETSGQPTLRTKRAAVPAGLGATVSLGTESRFYRKLAKT